MTTAKRGRVKQAGGKPAARQMSKKRRTSSRRKVVSEGTVLDSTAEAIVETITQPLLVLQSDLTVRRANGAFLRAFKVEMDDTRNVPLRELGNGQWDIPKLGVMLEGILASQEAVHDFRVEHDFESIGRRTMLLNARRLQHDAEDLILLTIDDVTERERLLWELESAKEFAEKTIDAVRDPLVVLGWDLRVKSANQPFYDTFQVSPDDTEGAMIYQLGNGQWNIPELRKLLEDILPNENEFNDYVVEHEFETIGLKVMMLNARRLDHEDLILLAIEDVTERKLAETRQTVLVGELQHRVKNILMNVRALARLSHQGARDKDDFMRNFSGRLDALARTQDLLVRTHANALSLEELIVLELDSVHAMKRVDLTGCDHQIPAQLAQPMSMVVHELTTNASKYGALASEQGRILVECRIEQEENGRFLYFCWREQGVEIQDRTPRKGFGTKIIEESLPYMMGGTSNLVFHSDGVECSMRFPLA